MASNSDGSPSEPRLWRAEHAGQAFDRDIAAARALVAERRGPHYLAHSTYGIRDFAVGTTDCWPASAAKAVFEDIGSQLNLVFTQLDRACEPLDSGPLIRLVLQGTTGTLFEFVKVPDQSFFGVVFGGGPEAVREADRAMADLTRESVERIGGTSLHWGGFRDRDSSGDLLIPGFARAGVPGGGPPGAVVPGGGPPGAVVTGGGPALPREVTDLCLLTLSPADVHSVGVFRRDQLVWSADIFDDRELGPFFERVAPSLRRRGYARLAHDLRLQYPRLMRLLEITGGTSLVRLVLDVARGAMFVLPLADDHYLAGVTLIQSEVDHADQKLRRLHSELLAVWPDVGALRVSYS